MVVSAPEPDPIAATEVLLLAQDPPVESSVSVAVVPWHSAEAPVINEGSGLTVSMAWFRQPVGNVYVMLVVPAPTAVNKPEVEPTDATAGLLLIQ